MSDYTHENVPVNVRLKDGAYQLGAVVDGAFFAFGSVKQGSFEDDVAEAKEASAKAQADTPAPGPVPPNQV